MPESFGGFSLAGMALALPIEVLREVVPAQTWLPMPCPVPSVVGGLELRGVVVPVLDLRQHLGLSEEPAAPLPCVLIVVHEGGLMGLLADHITGIFLADERGARAVTDGNSAHGVLAATVRRQDTGELTNVLSLSRLASQPGLPRVDDPEPEREHVERAELAAEPEHADDQLTLVLLQCGALPLSIDALAVHATVAKPELLPSPLARGACRGVIVEGGQQVPAVDLHALCGLGPLPPDLLRQAFVVAWPTGRVAFLVTEVMDVVRAPEPALLTVPAFALPAPALMGRVLPAEALPEVARVAFAERYPQFFMLERDRLMDHEEVMRLAEANAKAEGLNRDARSFLRGVQSVDQRAMLTYAMGQETATPLDQVDEILPIGRSQRSFDAEGPLLGFASHRGQAIPVLSLSRLTGAPDEVLTSAASVLVVQSDDELVGFAVPQLKSIEPSSWQPELPKLAGRRQLAQIGQGDEVRMVPVVDLRQLAAQLRQGEVSALMRR